MPLLKLSLLGILLIVQQTCQRDEDYAHKELLNTQWELASLRGEAVDSALKAPTLLFSANETRVNGFAGCNKFFGTYMLNEDSLSFSGIGSTKMFCEQSQELENNYIELLSMASHFVVSENGSTLTLLDTATPILEFRKK
ncbi:MAG TPA: META domain-containing protein [Anseongella sp.]